MFFDCEFWTQVKTLHAASIPIPFWEKEVIVFTDKSICYFFNLRKEERILSTGKSKYFQIEISILSKE